LREAFSITSEKKFTHALDGILGNGKFHRGNRPSPPQHKESTPSGMTTIFGDGAPTGFQHARKGRTSHGTGASPRVTISDEQTDHCAPAGSTRGQYSPFSINEARYFAIYRGKGARVQSLRRSRHGSRTFRQPVPEPAALRRPRIKAATSSATKG